MGGVIVRDDLIESFYFWEAYCCLRTGDASLTPSAFYREREAQLTAGNAEWLDRFGQSILGRRGWESGRAKSWTSVLASWQRLNVPIRSAIQTVRALADHTRLALIANQPREALDTIASLGICDFFEFIAIDACLPYSKPDIRFYESALEGMRCTPSGVLMVGDRIDNDIHPAQRLGLRSAWICFVPRPLQTQYLPAEWQRAYFSSIRRVGRHNQHTFIPELRNIKADYEASSLCRLFDLRSADLLQNPTGAEQRGRKHPEQVGDGTGGGGQGAQ